MLDSIGERTSLLTRFLTFDFYVGLRSRESSLRFWSSERDTFSRGKRFLTRDFLLDHRFLISYDYVVIQMREDLLHGHRCLNLQFVCVSPTKIKTELPSLSRRCQRSLRSLQVFFKLLDWNNIWLIFMTFQTFSWQGRKRVYQILFLISSFHSAATYP